MPSEIALMTNDDHESSANCVEYLTKEAMWIRHMDFEQTEHQAMTASLTAAAPCRTEHPTYLHQYRRGTELTAPQQ